MTTRETKTPEWLIERLALGELDAAAAADVRARLAAEGRSVEGELAALGISNREILEAHPPGKVVAAVKARATDARAAGKSRWFLAMPLILAGAAALVLVARPKPVVFTDGAEVGFEDPGTRIKGATALHVYRRAADKSERLEDGARAARGDLLQLAYRAGVGDGFTNDFGALLSIDGRGHVTVHWPEGDAAKAGRLSHKGEIKLPSAYELDDAPTFERFFFITADAPFSMKAVLDAANALAGRPADAHTQALALPPVLRQQSLTLDKTSKETP